MKEIRETFIPPAASSRCSSILVAVNFLVERVQRARRPHRGQRLHAVAGTKAILPSSKRR